MQARYARLHVRPRNSSLHPYELCYIDIMRQLEQMRSMRIISELTAILLIAFAIAACSDSDKPQEVVTPINANFLDVDLEPGYYCFCWDQFYAENHASVGDYKLRMVAGTWDNSLTFTIKQGTPHRLARECCDTATKSIFPLDKPTKDPPDFFGIALDSNAFSASDTIYVEVAVPVTSRVKLEISPILTR